MALIKNTLKTSLYEGLMRIYINQSAKATSGDENENPEDICKQIANDMADVIADAVDNYIKSGDIPITAGNILVTSPEGTCSVTPLNPAKIQ